MTTTKEFKTAKGLSDSAFNRLSNKIKADNPGLELTHRVNNRDWQIIDTALFEQYLTPKTVEASAVTPHASIQVLNPTRVSQLEDLANVAASMEVYKPKQIDLNGSQEVILDSIQFVASRVQEMNAINESRENALLERKDKNETAKNIITHLQQVAKGEELRASQINNEALEVNRDETDLKKQLADLLKALS